MIDPYKAKPGMTVFYQKPYMRSPEYGTIVQCGRQTFKYVHVLFLGDTTAKACLPGDLYWPPDFCAADRVNVEGQLFSGPDEWVAGGRD